MSKTKILVLHPSPSNLDAVIGKANVQNAKNGPFSAVVLLGSSLPAVETTTKPDVPTYFFGSTSADGAFVDVAPNFICVQTRRATIRLESGVTVAFLNDSKKPEADEDSAPEPAVKPDILFSYNWPSCIAAHERLTLVGDSVVDLVAANLQPRYHFAVGSEKGRFYEHPMFAWSEKRSCRFISLGQEGSGSKWFYAFALDGGRDDTANAAQNPYAVKRPREETVSEEIAGEEAAEQPRKLQKVDVKPARVVLPSECFFCLSNPKLETHMIVSIGKFSYLTIAKGPLPRPSRSFGFAGHAIIVPIEHAPLPSANEEVQQEISSYKQNLSKAFGEHEHETVFFEIHREQNVHFHIQMVPVPKKHIGSFEHALEEKCKVNNTTFERNHRLEFQKFSPGDEKIAAATEGDYLQFTVTSGESSTLYIAPLREEKMLDLQFPRRVLAYLLKAPKRVNWDRCRQARHEESEECQRFKDFYAKYDK